MVKSIPFDFTGVGLSFFSPFILFLANLSGVIILLQARIFD